MAKAKAKPSETEALKEFILWARKNHIAVAHVRIGEAEVSYSDPAAMAPSEPNLSPEAKPRQSIYQEFGGEMMQPATPATAQNEPTEEDEDD